MGSVVKFKTKAQIEYECDQIEYERDQQEQRAKTAEFVKFLERVVLRRRIKLATEAVERGTNFVWPNSNSRSVGKWRQITWDRED